MFNNHTISVVLDLNILGNDINNVDLLMVAAITSDCNYPDHPNIYNAEILVPPTEILMAWADGNPFILQNEYPAYLNCKDPDDMICALMAALTKKNIVLYIPYDEFNVFGQILLNHLYYQWGVTCNFNGAMFNIAPAKIPFIISKFYMMDIMDPQVYMSMYPANQPLPQWVIFKLAEDFKPFPYPASFAEYEAYFNNMNASKMQQKIEMVKVVK